jgi:UDP-N-acetylglucosamine--N-acetylmuramyl-(pentapeptide) pyrophosphoryl-undecaprenol N-acetylglucosamine transferase
LDNNRNIVLCAGGTGGHLFPAQALAKELSAMGWVVHLATDTRVRHFVADFDPAQTHIIKSATIGGRNPFNMVKSVFDLGLGYWQARALMKKLKPACVVGFGGYPTLPPVMAARARKIPILLHEQNAVMGRANRFLASKAQAIAMGFAAGNREKGADMREKVRVLGNPVRSEVLDASQIIQSPRKILDPFNLLVFGGSQGAQFFSSVLPAAIRLLDDELRSGLDLVQQARSEDELDLRSALADLGVKSQVAQFFSPMAERIARADFVVSRAGASTVSELAVIGRSSILVPYPFALDHDQAMNAAEMERAAGCKVIDQADLTPQRLADELKYAITHPQALDQMAKNAKQTGKPKAAKEFARLVEYIIAGNSISDFA